MVAVTESDVREVTQGDTAPPLEFAFLGADGATSRDLTGYAAWVTFWEAGAAAPHVIRQASISDAVNGMVRYDLQGDEYVTVGYCIFCCTIYNGASMAGFETTTAPIRRRVLAKAD